MIDIRHLREHPDAYRTSAKQRGIKVDIDGALAADQARLALISQVDELRAKLNIKGKPDEKQLADLQTTKADLEPLEKKLAAATDAFNQLALQIPNLLAEHTPEGGEEANREEKTWGKAEKHPHLKDHLTLAEANGWLDFERGAKVAGSKFYFAKNALVKLELSIVRMLYDLFEEQGFTFMQVPHLATNRIMSGTGFNPRGDERQIYEIKDSDLNLIATAEIPLTGYHADEILDPGRLPLLYAGYSPSYRTEGGAYGKYSKGLYRVHQFNKVEMYVFCQPEESEQWHQKLVEIEEQICQRLEIPYRLVRIAAGDLGAPAYKKFDIEYWSPVEGEYRELMSCSNCTDYQARRL
ncbi:MAG TPA: serine--tRNA ligase, partial [Candidatus Saccharimonadales bacterium]|nr:serine--tRNA ligase [Candidatus Saccharimonadales bacterium]